MIRTIALFHIHCNLVKVTFYLLTKKFQASISFAAQIAKVFVALYAVHVITAIYLFDIYLEEIIIL